MATGIVLSWQQTGKIKPDVEVFNIVQGSSAIILKLDKKAWSFQWQAAFKMVVTLYADLLSQPSRTVALFLKKTGIPHEIKEVALMKGEHKTPEYRAQVHRFGQVPAINDDGLNLIESIAILRYLARKYKVADHWYPQDMLKQAKVDEFLEWHHTGMRISFVMYTATGFYRPLLLGEKFDPKEVEMWKSKMVESLDLIENVWLEKNPFLAGNEISVADIVGISEIEQPCVANYDVTAGRPKIAAWMKRVKDELQPHYDEVFQAIYRFAEMIKSMK